MDFIFIYKTKQYQYFGTNDKMYLHIEQNIIILCKISVKQKNGAKS